MQRGQSVPETQVDPPDSDDQSVVRVRQAMQRDRYVGKSRRLLTLNRVRFQGRWDANTGEHSTSR